MLHRRSLLKGVVSLVPLPLLRKERSLAICPASEILTPEPNFEIPRSARRPLLSIEIDTHWDEFEVLIPRGELKPYVPKAPRMSVTITLLDKKGEEKEICFSKVEEVKFYTEIMDRSWVLKRTSSTYVNQKTVQQTSKTYTTPDGEWSVYFNMNVIKVYQGDDLFCAIRI